jgi:hypothetical protein
MATVASPPETRHDVGATERVKRYAGDTVAETAAIMREVFTSL